MATPDFLSGVPPELLARVLRSGSIGAEEQALQQRLQRGRALQQGVGQHYSSPWAAALGGLSDVVNTGRGAYEEQNALEGLEALNDERQGTRQALLDAYVGGAQRQRLTSPLMAPNIGMPNATGEEVAQADVLRAQQRRDEDDSVRQGVGYLGLLSGDSGIQDFSRALLRQDTGDLQEARLAQSAERLRLMADRTERQGALSERRLGLMESRARLQAENAETKAAEKKVADALKLEGDLRKEVMGNPVTKAYLESQVAFEKVQRAAKDPSAAGDLALIFGVMKTLDPGSTVREGEFANAQNAGGVGDRVVSLYNRVLAGQRLSPEQRADFVRTAGTQHAAQQAAFQRIVDAYRGVAQRAGANVNDVLPLGAGSAPVESTATPRVSTPAAPTGAPSIDLSAPPQTLKGPDGSRAKLNPDGTYSLE